MHTKVISKKKKIIKVTHLFKNKFIKNSFIALIYKTYLKIYSQPCACLFKTNTYIKLPITNKMLKHRNLLKILL